MVFPFLLLPVLFNSISYGAETSCNVRALLQREQIQLPIADSPVEKTDAEMIELFNQVRALLINEIKGGKPLTTLNPHQKLMITRLEKLNFEIKLCNDSEGSPGSNNNMQSLVTLCSYTKKASPLALVALIGHELGHSIDLVNLGCSYHKIKVPGNRLDTWLPPTASEGSNQEEFRRHLVEVSNAKSGHFLDTSFRQEPEQLAYIKKLSRDGRIETVDQGVPPEWNPARAAYSCLSNNYNYKKIPAKNEDIVNNYMDFSEPGAQIWGARALALYLRDPKNQPGSTKEALGLLAFSQLESVKKVDGKAIYIYSEKERQMNEIYFSEPSVQQALNCRPDPKQNCMSYFKPATVGGETPASSTKSALGQPGSR